jgi:UDP:flavonoid glycosyltransferase YjiC (YdhE family)
LSAERLTQVIQAATSDRVMRQRASDMGAAIRTEDGVGRAVAIIQRHI